MNKKIKNLLSQALYYIPDKPYSEITFLLKQKRLPNLKSPEKFNDKLLAMKLSVRNPLYKTLVNKFAVREHIAKSIGSEYLIPLIGVYSDPSEVDFDSLPNQFVLKLTSGSQNNLICQDKSTLDWEKASRNIRTWLKQDPYKRTREWQYKDLPDRFVIEEYISDKHNKTTDYKYWCFDGRPELVQIDTDRFTEHKRTFYKAESFEKTDLKMAYNQDEKLPKPLNYNMMLELAAELSDGFPFVRVDFYNIDGKIYFGEITFHPDNCNGKITPSKYERILGDKLKYSKTTS